MAASVVGLFLTLPFGPVLSEVTAAEGSRATPVQPETKQSSPSSRPVVTARVYFDVSVNGQNIGRLIFGLFGKDAPKTVETFLSLIPKTTSKGIQDPNQPLTYENSVFYRCIPGEQLDLGRISNLNAITINDRVYYDFQGKLLEAPANLEANSVSPFQRGLLTKELFHIGPEFTITLDSSFPASNSYTVFGQLEDGMNVLKEIEKLPVRTDRSMEPEGSLADDMFRAQKRFMTSFGQQVLKDRRALEAYPYKILRRVVVTDCGRIS